MAIEVPRRVFREISRRRFLSTGAGALGVMAMPYLSRAADRPQMTHGVQSGDVGTDGGVVWARADRPSQMLVEVATTESFSHARALPPIAALPESDFTAKCCWKISPPDRIFSIASGSATCRIRTFPASR